MALIVENGTGLADAEAYCTVAYADKYFGDRGVQVWVDLDTDVKEAAIRRSTDFMTQRYRLRWLGNRVSITQSLDWPRYNVIIPDSPGGYRGYPAVIPYNVIPKVVQSANAEFAYRVTQGIDLSPDLDAFVKSKKVGPIEITYMRGEQSGLDFRAIENLLRAVLGPSSSFLVQRA